MWSKPWSYKEGLIIGAGLLTAANNGRRYQLESVCLAG